MKKIAFIGCGGINSWAIKNINELSKTFEKEMMIKLFDDDIVEEKNLQRANQNFEPEDLMKQKAEALGDRYNYLYEVCLITEETVHKLEPYDYIILGVDNNKTRKLVYNYCLNKNKYLLDLRAQGTQMAYYVLDHKKDIKYYNEKFFSNENVMDRKGSCQLASDIEDDHIENANKIIAFFGINGIFLKELRGDKLSVNEWQFVY